MMRIFILAALAGSAFALSGCGEPCEGLECTSARTNVPGANGAGSDPAAGGPGSEGMTCTNAAKAHMGFGAVNLSEARAEGKGGADRGRPKTYEVLTTDYARVLGSAPPSMAKLGATFGAAKPRWHVEPQPTAVMMSSALGVAFEGCLERTRTAPEFESAPEASTALAACSSMARKFWSRVVKPEDVQGCVDVAVTGSVKETYATGADGAPMATNTTPRRRWAYACASLLTSTQFLSY